MENRFFVFLGVFLACLILQYKFPIEKKEKESLKRLAHNFGHLFVSKFFLWFLFAFVLIDPMAFSKKYEFGLLSFLGRGSYIKMFLSCVILDFAIYWQHRVFHRVPAFWKLHRLHHNDFELTTSTAVRFHFLEILLSYIWKACVVLGFGISLGHLLIFEIYLNACALFHHTNLKLPASLEKVLEKVFVTPGIHRVHHSVDLKLTHSNFGFSVVFWDKLFKSFNAARPVEQVGVLGTKEKAHFAKELMLAD